MKRNLLLLFVAVFFAILFLYRLDWTTLGSWDEAWYGSIARALLYSKNPLHMIWNGNSYYDHPPLGFWTMAISYTLFGINEFTTRLPSALFGIGSIITLFLFTREITHKNYIACIASLVLGTCVWYTMRVRSGNLESIFVFFSILTLYISTISLRKPKLIPLIGASFGLVILSKTLVGVSLIVPIIFLHWKSIINKKCLKYWVMSLTLLIIIVAPWYLWNAFRFDNFYQHHFLTIGTRNKTLVSYFHFTSLSQVLFYIHMGIRKWYYVWLIMSGYLIVRGKFRNNYIGAILLWLLVTIFPFLSSEKTELWHLIPLYPAISIIIALGAHTIFQDILLTTTFFFKKKFVDTFKVALLGQTVIVVGFCILAGLQIKIFYSEVIPQTRYTPDDVAVVKAAGGLNKKIYLDDDFIPIGVFYSNKIIHTPPAEGISNSRLYNLLSQNEKNYVVVTRNWAVENLEIQKLHPKIIYRNDTFSIIEK